ncbi:hypothetical protein [Marinicrinis lubricantis]|uniref:Uncharacterized protein n=1 Tax=Marinicrinis lubricantis TaxID=2086470 RepID=A0ABW1IQX2_9BACL
MENEWVQFLQDKWYIILAAVVIVAIIIRIVKTVVKWVLVLAIAVSLIYYGSNYTDEIKAAGEKIWSYAKDEAMETMMDEASQAEYQVNSDGTFTIVSPNFKLDSVLNSDDVKITFKGQTFTMSRNSLINDFIERATPK